MNTIEQHITFVKEQLAFHKGREEQFANIPARAKKHKETALRFDTLLRDLESWRQSNSNTADLSAQINRLSLRPEDVNDLPDELIKELSISNTDKTEFLLMEIVEDIGGIASLDQILVALYRRTGEILKRTGLTSRLYRMAQKRLIFNVPNKKGIYSLHDFQSERQGGSSKIDSHQEEVEDRRLG